MKRIGIALAFVLSGNCAAFATGDASCAVAEPLLSVDFPLPRVVAAIKARKLDIVVVGSTSSTLPDASGPDKGYPWRLEAALAKKLPDVAVKVTVYAKPREPVAAMQEQLTQSLVSDKPALVIWQTGTVEAMRRTEMDEFRSILDDGIDAAKTAKSDVILMNMQYSPRTELMFAGPPYANAMRFVAMQHEIPLFDRLSIMRHWGELGTFDFNETTRKLDTAAKVHDCIGRLLARQIVESTHLPNTAGNAIR
jgi:hypothetical protein